MLSNQIDCPCLVRLMVIKRKIFNYMPICISLISVKLYIGNKRTESTEKTTNKKQLNGEEGVLQPFVIADDNKNAMNEIIILKIARKINAYCATHILIFALCHLKSEVSWKWAKIISKNNINYFALKTMSRPICMCRTHLFMVNKRTNEPYTV